MLFGASAVVRYYKPRVEASVSVRHILASKKCHMGLGVDQKCGLRVPGYLAMTVMVPASLCNGVGMQPVSSAALPAVTCPTRTNSIGLICIHMFTLAVLCIRAAVGLPPKVVLRVRGCLQLTWLGELVRTFSSEPGTRGPGHHDAMTEAPGRKNDCHFSSVPGARGRAAKIGEVFCAFFTRFSVACPHDRSSPQHTTHNIDGSEPRYTLGRKHPIE